MVFKADALVDESHGGGFSVLALVVSSLHASLASTLTDAGCSFSGARSPLSDMRIYPAEALSEPRSMR